MRTNSPGARSERSVLGMVSHCAWSALFDLFPYLCYSIVDIRGLTQLAHRYGALVSVDNTMMSPYLQKVSQLSTACNIIKR